MRDHYQQQQQALAEAMADRREWEQGTAHSRRLAIDADADYAAAISCGPVGLSRRVAQISLICLVSFQ
jgi:hypothetical protein